MKPTHAPTHLYVYSVDRLLAVKISHLKKVDFDAYTGSRNELGGECQKGRSRDSEIVLQIVSIYLVFPFKEIARDCTQKSKLVYIITSSQRTVEYAMFIFHSMVIMVGRLPGAKSTVDSVNNGFNQGICSLLTPGVKFCLSLDSRITEDLV